MESGFWGDNYRVFFFVAYLCSLNETGFYTRKHMGSFVDWGLCENNWVFLHKSLKAVPIFQFCFRLIKFSVLLAIGISLLILRVLRDFCMYLSSVSRKCSCLL